LSPQQLQRVFNGIPTAPVTPIHGSKQQVDLSDLKQKHLQIESLGLQDRPISEVPPSTTVVFNSTAI
jgi:hypothetical protein